MKIDIEVEVGVEVVVVIEVCVYYNAEHDKRGQSRSRQGRTGKGWVLCDML